MNGKKVWIEARTEKKNTANILINWIDYDVVVANFILFLFSDIWLCIVCAFRIVWIVIFSIRQQQFELIHMWNIGWQCQCHSHIRTFISISLSLSVNLHCVCAEAVHAKWMWFESICSVRFGLVYTFNVHICMCVYKMIVTHVVWRAHCSPIQAFTTVAMHKCIIHTLYGIAMLTSTESTVP